MCISMTIRVSGLMSMLQVYIQVTEDSLARDVDELVMAYIVMAYVVMAYMFMATGDRGLACKRHRRVSDGLYSYGSYSYGHR